LIAQAAASASVSGSIEEKVKSAFVTEFGEAEWLAAHAIIMRESKFDPGAVNRRSGACGLFQALPCSKMGGMEVDNQISWGVNYIRRRYGTPSKALAFWNMHGYY